MQQVLHDYLSALRSTARPRFSFAPPPASVLQSDLAEALRYAVEQSGCTFRHTPEVAQTLALLARWFTEGKPGLLLTGTCGTGKTKLMEAVNLLINHYSHGIQRLNIINANRINELSLSAHEDDRELLRRQATFRYVGIDDLGTEAVSVKNFGTDLSPVLDTLYARYESRLVTIITTNDSLDTLGRKYGPRLHDRLCELYSRIPFNFGSFRRG